MTKGEDYLWQALRRKQLGVHFRRDMPLGPYFPDFTAPSVRLVVEVDGRTHESEEARQRDKARQTWMEMRGWQVLRFQDETIIGGSQAVIETIRAAVQARLGIEKEG